MTEAELVFSEILDYNIADLYLNRDLLLSRDKAVFVSSVLRRRFAGEPLQYILGKTEFMGLEFRVDTNVFIPRPETEILVETAIKIVRGLTGSRVRGLTILDIGTGSGCIAVSLAKLLPNVKVTATDISLGALETARYNALLNNVSDKVSFVSSDLFAQYSILNTQYDIIISNPPYIPTAEIDTLRPEISYEPRIALDGGKDGLDFYRMIIVQASSHLKECGFLIMEMGFNQCSSIKEIVNSSGRYEIIEVVKDYNHIDRVIVAKNINSKS